MGEVSGDSSSPLLQIPSPISQTQRAGLHCQAPTQPCYLSLSLTHTNTWRQNRHSHPSYRWTLTVSLCSPFSLLFCLSHKHLQTVDKLLHLFFVRLPSSLSHTNTRRQILWLWHTHSGRWSVSLFCVPLFYISHTYTQRNWTNHLQVCSIFDALLQEANLLLFNNQAYFELPSLPVVLTWRSVLKPCIMQGRKLVNCRTSHEHLVLPSPFYSQWQVRVIQFFSVSLVPERLETQQNNVTWQQHFTTISPRCLKKYSGTTAPFPLKWTLKEKPRSTVNS